eukprot:s435_g13.t1
MPPLWKATAAGSQAEGMCLDCGFSFGRSGYGLHRPRELAELALVMSADFLPKEEEEALRLCQIESHLDSSGFLVCFCREFSHF